jgi:putative acyl-CoA dehydrogenase
MSHAVTNQPPPLEGYDAFADDPWLADAAARLGLDEGARQRASALGRYVATPEAQADAAAANRNPPVLRTHDRYGHRIDEVEYHPSYHALMAQALGAGVHSSAWKDEARGFATHALLFYLWNELEQGTACPVTMTFASIPVMAHAPAVEALWKPRVLADAYEPALAPIVSKGAATIGMAMTEKQGGSDLRAVATVATRDADAWRLDGHKWFCSAPMSDGFFTLARAPEGVTCFFVPRVLPDGTRNAVRLQRLKDKCGNRSNASAEIEYESTWASLVGEPGRGIATLIEMAHHTRFDIVVGVAGMMRMGLNHALHHAQHRAAFGRTLIDHPLMANVLADLALETQAATLLALRLAQAFDARGHDAAENELQRLVTPIAKYWLCKRMTAVAVEAMECLGGNGYVEEAPLARLYREAPLNGIWEGSANVICLDALRALRRSPAAFEALAGEIARAKDPRADRQVDEAGRRLADPATAETGARAVVERLALALQASLMRRHAAPMAAEAFSVSRLEARGAHSFGTLEAAFDVGALAREARLGR